jgi:hypothetical protein
MSYNDEIDRNYVCLIDLGTTCRHMDCAFKNKKACGVGNGYNSHSPNYRTCLKPTGHGGTLHQNHNLRWPMAPPPPVEVVMPEEHVCPKPDVLFVSFETIERIEKFVEELKDASADLDVYDTLRLIIDTIEKRAKS